MGTFDYLNMRINGYQFHMDLMAHKESLGPEEGQRRLRHLEGAAAVPGPERARPHLAGGGADPRRQEGRHVPARHVRRPAVHRQGGRSTTSTSSRSRRSTDANGQDAVEAPIDGFMLSARRAASNQAARRLAGVPRHPGRPGRLRSRSTRPTSPTSQGRRHLQLQRPAEEVRRRSSPTPRASPVPRPRRAARHGQQRHDPGPAGVHQGRHRRREATWKPRPRRCTQRSRR